MEGTGFHFLKREPAEAATALRGGSQRRPGRVAEHHRGAGPAPRGGGSKHTPLLPA